MEERTRRIAQNEALARDVNKNIIAAEEQRPSEDDDRWKFVCECGHGECRQTVRLTSTEYEEIRRSPRLFFVVAGHEIPEEEDVVEDRGGYRIIAKRGEAGAYVEERI